MVAPTWGPRWQRLCPRGCAPPAVWHCRTYYPRVPPRTSPSDCPCPLQLPCTEWLQFVPLKFVQNTINRLSHPLKVHIIYVLFRLCRNIYSINCGGTYSASICHSAMVPGGGVALLPPTSRDACARGSPGPPDSCCNYSYNKYTSSNTGTIYRDNTMNCRLVLYTEVLL